MQTKATVRHHSKPTKGQKDPTTKRLHVRSVSLGPYNPLLAGQQKRSTDMVTEAVFTIE